MKLEMIFFDRNKLELMKQSNLLSSYKEEKVSEYKADLAKISAGTLFKRGMKLKEIDSKDFVKTVKL